MIYPDEEGGRVLKDASGGGSFRIDAAAEALRVALGVEVVADCGGVAGAGQMMTWFDMRDALVEAVRLQRRTESGKWPFAGDGPWHLVEEEKQPDWGMRDGNVAAARIPKLPLGREEVARLKEAMGWMALVPGDDDRRLIKLVVVALARPHASQVPWRRIAADAGLGIGEDGCARRFERALGALVVRVNRGGGARTWRVGKAG